MSSALWIEQRKAAEAAQNEVDEAELPWEKPRITPHPHPQPQGWALWCCNQHQGVLAQMMEQQHRFFFKWRPVLGKNSKIQGLWENSNSKSLFYKDCSSERFYELKNTSFGPWSHASRTLACLVQTHTQNEGCSENIPADVSEGDAEEPLAECRNRSCQKQVLAAHRNQTSQNTFCPTDRRDWNNNFLYFISKMPCFLFLFSQLYKVSLEGAGWEAGGPFLSVSFCQCAKWSNSWTPKLNLQWDCTSSVKQNPQNSFSKLFMKSARHFETKSLISVLLLSLKICFRLGLELLVCSIIL